MILFFILINLVFGTLNNQHLAVFFCSTTMNFAEFANMYAGHEIDNVATPKTSSNVKPKGPGEAEESLHVLITGIVFFNYCTSNKLASKTVCTFVLA